MCVCVSLTPGNLCLIDAANAEAGRVAIPIRISLHHCTPTHVSCYIHRVAYPEGVGVRLLVIVGSFNSVAAVRHGIA